MSDAALSAPMTYAYLVVTERAQSRSAERAAVRQRVGLHRGRSLREPTSGTRRIDAGWRSEPEDRRRRVGRTRRHRRSAGDSEAGAGRRAGDRAGGPAPAGHAGARRALGRARCCRPTDRTRLSVGAADNNTDRWLVRVDPATGRTRRARPRCTTTRGCARSARRQHSGGLGWLPDNRRVWFLAEHDGWMHLYTVDVAAAPAPARRHRRAASRSTRRRWRRTARRSTPVHRAASRRAAHLRGERDGGARAPG